jgi:hypothetical protein
MGHFTLREQSWVRAETRCFPQSVAVPESLTAPALPVWLSPSVDARGASLQIVQLHGHFCLRVSWGVAPSASAGVISQRPISPMQPLERMSS